MFLKPMHFWRYSDVIMFWDGSVELVLSSGGMQFSGVKRMDWKGLWVGKGAGDEDMAETEEDGRMRSSDS